MVELTEEEYNNLIERDAILTALESCGVDSWDGYDIAMETYQAWSEVSEGL